MFEVGIIDDGIKKVMGSFTTSEAAKAYYRYSVERKVLCRVWEDGVPMLIFEADEWAKRRAGNDYNTIHRPAVDMRARITKGY